MERSGHGADRPDRVRCVQGTAAPKNGGRHHRTDHRSCADEDIKEKWIMKKYIFLGSAILFEVAGTTMLNLSEGFSNLMPTIAKAICFGLSFTSRVFDV